MDMTALVLACTHAKAEPLTSHQLHQLSSLLPGCPHGRECALFYLTSCDAVVCNLDSSFSLHYKQLLLVWCARCWAVACKDMTIDDSAGRHLDADEAIVRGAALYAANLSTTFRLNRKFGMADGAVYPVSFQVHIGNLMPSVS